MSDDPPGAPDADDVTSRAPEATVRTRVIVLAAVCVVLAVVLVGVLIAALSAPAAGSASAAATARPTPAPTITALPVPDTSVAPASTPWCDREDVKTALANGDDAAVIAAAGGGEGFRRLVVEGAASCIGLRDPAHEWFVVNKSMPMEPIDYAPYDWAAPAGIPLGNLAVVRTDVAPTLTAMSEAAQAAGAGSMGMQNGYRGYDVQKRIHDQRVAQLGLEAGERLAARPGYSEHQSGLAADVFGCTPGCSSAEAFGDTATYAWVVEHGWEYGWIVRYEEGQTPITGYQPEAWHLRYIGPELGRAYHEGGYRTLEEFFGLPAAPAYVD